VKVGTVTGNLGEVADIISLLVAGTTLVIWVFKAQKKNDDGEVDHLTRLVFGKHLMLKQRIENGMIIHQAQQEDLEQLTLDHDNKEEQYRRVIHQEEHSV